MKTKTKLALISLMMALLLAACGQSTETRQFALEQGTEVDISLKANSGYTLVDNEVGFSLTNEANETVLDGIFVGNDVYQRYVEIIEEGIKDGTCEVVEEKSGELLRWNYSSEEYTAFNQILHIDGTDTYLLLTSTMGQEDAERATACLNIKGLSSTSDI